MYNILRMDKFHCTEQLLHKISTIKSNTLYNQYEIENSGNWLAVELMLSTSNDYEKLEKHIA
jgi:hypothetical protein